MSRRSVPRDFWEKFYNDYPEYAPGSEEEESEEEGAGGQEEGQIPVAAPKKRGRPKIPPKWTRVINVDQDSFERLKQYDIAAELLLESAEIQPPAQRGRPPKWSMHFEPKQWHKDHKEQTMESCQLSTAKLLKYGQELKHIRERLRQKALSLEAGEQNLEAEAQGLQAVHNLAARMQRGYFKGKVLQPKAVGDFPAVSAAPCRKIQKVRRLTLEQKYAVVHAVLIKQEFQVDVAREFYVRPMTVSNLVNKAKRKPEFLRELAAKQEEEARTRAAVSDLVQQLNKEDVFIGSAAEVVK